MSWYTTGTIAVTNGSATITGTGTAFVANVQPGFAFLGPDYSVYEVLSVNSDTSLTLTGAGYRGTTLSAQAYGIFQTQGIISNLSTQVATLLSTFGPLRTAVPTILTWTTAATSTLVAGTDFTPGTTTSVTLSRAYTSTAQFSIFFDGVFQGPDQIASVIGTTCTFTSPIPVGVSRVYEKGAIPLGIGTPADAAITVPKLASDTLALINTPLADYTALRAFSSTVKSVYLTAYLVTSAPSGIAGMFVRDDSDTTSADNGGTVIVNPTTGVRWKRPITNTVRAEWFGVTCNGVTDDTAASILAFNSVVSGQTLEFPQGILKLSYAGGGWAPLTDTYTVSAGSGRGRAVGFISGKNNIAIRGNCTQVLTVNHDIAANGGFSFLWINQSPNVTVEGFYFNMSFVNYLDNAAFYPLCGGVIAIDKYAGAGTQSALNSNFTAKNLTFKLYHPLGSFGITSHPYGGDNNNAFKIISVFASGDSAATVYDQQSRGLTIKDIHFLDGHNGYGTWGVAYNIAKFKDIVADGWVASSYTIAGAVSTGVNFISPVRFYQYYTSDLYIGNITVRSKPWASRTGAFVGLCGAVAAEYGLTGSSLTTGKSVIENISCTLDSGSSALGSTFDVAVLSYLNGTTSISDVNFDAYTLSGVVGLYLVGNDDASEANYTVTDLSSGVNVSGPPIQLVNGSNTSAANRSIKSLNIRGGTFKGWGGEGGIYSYRTGFTYHGVEILIVNGNVFKGENASTLLGSAVDVRSTQATDASNVANNGITGASTPIQLGSFVTPQVQNNTYGTNTGNGSHINYLSGGNLALTTYAAGQAVAVAATGSQYYSYTYIEYSAAGAVVTFLSNIANAATGTIRTVGTGNTGKLTQQLIGNIK